MTRFSYLKKIRPGLRNSDSNLIAAAPKKFSPETRKFRNIPAETFAVLINACCHAHRRKSEDSFRLHHPEGFIHSRQNNVAGRAKDRGRCMRKNDLKCIIRKWNRFRTGTDIGNARKFLVELPTVVIRMHEEDCRLQGINFCGAELHKSIKVPPDIIQFFKRNERREHFGTEEIARHRQIRTRINGENFRSSGFAGIRKITIPGTDIENFFIPNVTPVETQTTEYQSGSAFACLNGFRMHKNMKKRLDKITT